VTEDLTSTGYAEDDRFLRWGLSLWQVYICCQWSRTVASLRFLRN